MRWPARLVSWPETARPRHEPRPNSVIDAPAAVVPCAEGRSSPRSPATDGDGVDPPAEVPPHLPVRAHRGGKGGLTEAPGPGQGGGQAHRPAGLLADCRDRLPCLGPRHEPLRYDRPWRQRRIIRLASLLFPGPGCEGDHGEREQRSDGGPRVAVQYVQDSGPSVLARCCVGRDAHRGGQHQVHGGGRRHGERWGSWQVAVIPRCPTWCALRTGTRWAQGCGGAGQGCGVTRWATRAARSSSRVP